MKANLDSIVFDYQHLNQNEKKYQFIRDRFKDNYEGLCWFFCLTMSVHAHLRVKNVDELIDKLYGATIDLNQEEFKKIISEIRNIKNKKQILFIEESNLIDVNGGLKSDFVCQNPDVFARFTNQLFRNHKIPVCIDLLTKINRFGASEISDLLKTRIQNNFVPIVGMDMIENGKYVGGHMIVIGGVTENGFIISDPNQNTTSIIQLELFEKYIKEKAIIYGHGRNLSIDEKSLIVFVRRRKKYRVKLLD